MLRRITKGHRLGARGDVAATQQRSMNVPGWKTMMSTKDIRTKEQKERDRKTRHIEKLPKPVAMHSPQYPYEKVILTDREFQPIVFDDHLDTPSLFHLETPSDFSIYWNCSDFNRPSYPPVPEVDHRLLPVGASEEAWKRHLLLQRAYLKKHKITPNFFSSFEPAANLSVVFSGTYETRARTDEDGKLIPPPPPETALHHRNFWMTSHCGNYIDLHELQQAPSIFFRLSAEEAAEPGAYYTLVMMSPDYPYRADTNKGFLLNYMVANISATGDPSKPREGVPVVSYVPPLPTEDAGTVRQLCVLYKQRGGRIDPADIRPMTEHEAQSVFPFEQRSNFRLHDQSSEAARTLRTACYSLAATEAVLDPSPAAITFFQTTWDIQVQEFYEAHNLAEPAYSHDEQLEAGLRWLATAPEEYQVSSRYLADGTVNNAKTPEYFTQTVKTLMGTSSAMEYRSRRLLLGANKREVIRPNLGQRLP